MQADFSGQTFKHLLLPVWLVSFDYGARSFQVLVNGVTGQIAGKYPKSAAKIFFFVLFLLAVIGIIVLVGSNR